MTYPSQPPQLPQSPQNQQYPPQPPQNQQNPPQYGQQPAQAPNSTLALIGFWLAIGSVVGIIIPIINFLVIFAAPAALVISIIANSQVKNSNGSMGGKGFAVAGIWISAIWMGLGLILVIIFGALIASMIPRL
ncbi:MAG TPA: hypothetical protein VGK74_15775 [Symbiobacteriaceae bacterium]